MGRKLTIIVLIVLIVALILKLNDSSFETPDQAAAEIQKKCIDDETCYFQYLKKYSSTKGHSEAFIVLSRIVKSNNKMSSGCHLLAHGIGSGAFESNPKDLHRIIASIDRSCSYGGIHGVIESYMGSIQSSNVFDEKILNTICTKDTPSCHHALGHVLLVESQNDLKKSIMACQKFQQKESESCFTGVFMEHVYPTNLVAHGITDKKELAALPERLPDLIEVCNVFQEEDVQNVCWGEIVRASFVSDPAFDMKKTLDFCNSNAPGFAQTKCKQRAIEMLAITKKFNILSLKPSCLLQPEDSNFELECYKTLVRIKLISDSYSTQSDASEFCESLKPSYRSSCSKVANAVIKSQALQKARKKA